MLHLKQDLKGLDPELMELKEERRSLRMTSVSQILNFVFFSHLCSLTLVKYSCKLPDHARQMDTTTSTFLSSLLYKIYQLNKPALWLSS